MLYFEMEKKTQAEMQDRFGAPEVPEGCLRVRDNEMLAKDIDEYLQRVIIEVREMPQWKIDVASKVFGTNFMK